MISKGRPLSFLLAVLLCWSGARIVANWTPVEPPAAKAATATAPQNHRPDRSHSFLAAPARIAIAPRAASTHPVSPTTAIHNAGRDGNREAVQFIDTGALTIASNDDQRPGFSSTSSLAYPAPLPPALSATARDRWRLSLWALFRPDGAGGKARILSTGRLGASQAGVRLDFDIDPTALARMVVYGRVTSAMALPHSPEAAAGFSYQPRRALPVSIGLERRIALGQGARDAMAVTVISGFGPTDLAPPLGAEGYAQAGIVGFRSTDPFIDGKLSLFTALNQASARIGASMSGGAQPGLHRLDIGPELQTRLPLPDVPARLAIEWRERVSGNVHPASGLTLTLAADF